MDETLTGVFIAVIFVGISFLYFWVKSIKPPRDFWQ